MFVTSAARTPCPSWGSRYSRSRRSPAAASAGWRSTGPGSAPIGRLADDRPAGRRDGCSASRAVVIAQLGRPVGRGGLGAVLAFAVAGGVAVAIQAALNGRVSAGEHDRGRATAVNFAVNTPVMLLAVGRRRCSVRAGRNPGPASGTSTSAGRSSVVIVDDPRDQRAGRRGAAHRAGHRGRPARRRDAARRTHAGRSGGRAALLAGAVLTSWRSRSPGRAPADRKRSSTAYLVPARARGPALEPHRAGARGAALPDPVPHGAVRVGRRLRRLHVLRRRPGDRRPRRPGGRQDQDGDPATVETVPVRA